jgi:opacity protein-like surface antigen
LSDQLRIFNEAQFADLDTQAGIGHVLGIEFAPRGGWTIGASLQSGEFSVSGGAVERNAGSVSVGFGGPRLNWSSRVEYREDSGVTEATQYVLVNRVDFKLRDAFRLLGKVNFSATEQDVARLNDGRLLFGQPSSDARFAEATLGLAYRPTEHDRFNWLGRITWLYDLTSFGQSDFDAAGEGVLSLLQSGRTDQKSLVASWEGVYRLTPRLDLGGKVARRTGEVRLDRGAGSWIDSAATFAGARVSYEIVSKWDAMVEYRWLDVPDARSTRAGFLVSVDREIARGFRVGVGYNFTDFSDDLTDYDYDFRGIFVNVVGKY